MATTEIEQFGSGGSGSPNVLSQSAYVSFLATLTGNSFADGATPSAQQINKIIRQPSFVAAALSNALVNAGISVPDDGNVGVLAANIAKAFTTGVVGDSRNLAMTVSAASTSATLKADQLIVADTLGGQAFKLASFSKSINLATTGAGGMDTGAAPASGFIALYAIYNPTTATSALLGVNATSAIAPEIYGGANMPAGYTMSALVSVWPTNASSQFGVGVQQGRSISGGGTVLNTSVQKSSWTSLSVAASVPLNAKTISGNTNVLQTGSSTVVRTNIYLASDSNGSNKIQSAHSDTSGNGLESAYYGLILAQPQTIYYETTTTDGTLTASIAITGYTI